MFSHENLQPQRAVSFVVCFVPIDGFFFVGVVLCAGNTCCGDDRPAAQDENDVEKDEKNDALLLLSLVAWPPRMRWMTPNSTRKDSTMKTR